MNSAKGTAMRTHRSSPLVVTVTAPKGGPGKTMLSMLLGYTAAKMGLRVLVVGCGIANDEHTDRAKLMLTQNAGRVPTLRDRPYPQQWWRDPVTGYQVVPAARSREERTREVVLSDVRWLVEAAQGAVDVIFLDAPPPESDPLTEALLGVADVLLMVLSHDGSLQSRAIEDLRSLTNSSSGRPMLDPTQVRVVYSCLNGDVRQSDIDRAREKFDDWLWVGHVPYHQAVWRGGNAGDLFGSAPAKVMEAAEGITRKLLGVLAGPLPSPTRHRIGWLRRRRHAVVSVPTALEAALRATAPAATTPLPPPAPRSAPALIGLALPAQPAVLAEQPPEVQPDGTLPSTIDRPRALLEVFALPVPRIRTTSGVPVPEGVAMVTPFLLAAKGRAQDIEMLAESGAGSRTKPWTRKAWENLYRTPERSSADALAVKVNRMISLEPGVRTDYQWISDLVAAAHDTRRPTVERVDHLNAAVHQLATLAGEAYGGAQGAASREWRWAHDYDWLDGRNAAVHVAQVAALNSAVDAAKIWLSLADEQGAMPIRSMIAMLLRLEAVVVPDYAPWVVIRAGAELVSSRHSTPSEHSAILRRTRELVAGGETADQTVVQLLGVG
ncbi:MAG: hypothetical protein ABMA25_10950 [Ilumatobacteraceae bacterium]